MNEPYRISRVWESPKMTVNEVKLKQDSSPISHIDLGVKGLKNDGPQKGFKFQKRIIRDLKF